MLLFNVRQFGVQLLDGGLKALFLSLHLQFGRV